MPSGPTLFDDEDGPGPDRDAAGVDAVDDRAATSTRSRRPNYLIRRAVVVGGVVAVLATASIVVGQLIRAGTDESTSGAVGTDWNRIVLVDDRSGRVVVVDTAGEELARIQSGVRSPTASAVVDSSLLVAGSSNVALLDIGDDTVAEFDLGADTIVRPAGSALTMIAPRVDGGRALVVHGPSGDVIDTDTFAPVVGARYEFGDSRASASGRDVLVTDSGNFQSVLFSFDRDEPSFFPGLALAVTDDLVVTAQNIGADATVTVFDHAGEPITTGRTPSVRAGMIADSGIVLVTVDGAVVVMSPSTGETSGGGRLDIGTIETGNVTTSGDRLVVTGATGVAIVDQEASVVASFDEQQPVGDGRPPLGSACLATVTSVPASSNGVESLIAIVEFTDGDTLVEANGTGPVLADSSGCVAGVPTPDGFDLLASDGVQRFQTGDELLALSLDGASVVTERDGRVVLLDTTNGDTQPPEPIDLGPSGRTAHVTQA